MRKEIELLSPTGEIIKSYTTDLNKQTQYDDYQNIINVLLNGFDNYLENQINIANDYNKHIADNIKKLNQLKKLIRK